MVLSESDYGHQALSDITPLRDIFGLLFFTSVGMLFDPIYLFENWVKVLSLVMVIAAFKGSIFSMLAILFRYVNIVPIAVGLGLFQVGEFSFVLARLGLETKSINQDMYSLLLAVSVLSMMLTPFASAMTTPLYKLKKRLFTHEPLQTENIPNSGLKGHVVIAGGGRVGQHIAQVLSQLGIPFVIIEINHQRMLECKAVKFPVIYGDISHPTVFKLAKIDSAKLLLITTPEVTTSQSIVKQSHRQNPELHIIARADGIDQTRALYESGIYMAVLPEMEAGLEIARQALLHLGVPVSVIQQYTDAVRQNLYLPIYQSQEGHEILTKLGNVKNMLEISWVTIPPGSPLANTSLGDAAVRTKTGASIVGIIHGKEFYSNPKVDYTFQSGDMVAVVGNTFERNAFNQLAGA
jgi:CPA2 family monovalent cation:H+ antiporter-2